MFRVVPLFRIGVIEHQYLYAGTLRYYSIIYSQHNSLTSHFLLSSTNYNQSNTNQPLTRFPTPRCAIRDASLPVREGVHRRGPQEGGGHGRGRPHTAAECPVYIQGTAQEAYQYDVELQYQYTVYFAAG